MYSQLMDPTGTRVYADLMDELQEQTAAGIAAQFLGVERVRLLYDQIFIKAPATNVRTPWHNDLPNWPVRGTQLMTVWVALDTIGAGNGRLEFLRGSHRWNHWVSGLFADVDGRVTHFFVRPGD